MEKIQYITRDSDRFSHAEQALFMFQMGIKWVQLRMKNASRSALRHEALSILKYAEKEGGTLILNDDVMLAKRLRVSAVHLGLNDMPIDEARAILGEEVMIGGTANTFEQIKLQVARGADYVGVGPFRFTSTKEKLSPTLGLEGYKMLISQMKKANINVPLFAVGGITSGDVSDLESVGVKHFAASGDWFRLMGN